MSPYTAPVEVVNAALARMGVRPVQGLDETSKPAIVANDMYEGIVASLFARHYWLFALKEDKLQYQGTTTGEYSAVYSLPADLVSLVNVTSSGKLIDYRILSGKVVCNHGSETELRALYVYRALEGSWPPDFADAVVVRLQAEFQRALREDEPVAQSLERMAEMKFIRAMVRDKRQAPPRPEMRINGGRLASAWRGGL